MLKYMLYICAAFYGLLCVFSIVTGLMYAGGKRKLNPLELSDSFVAKLNTEEKLTSFAKKMGWVTFVVGLFQGLSSYAIIRAGSPILYCIAYGFTVFSIASVVFKLKGKINAFPLLKLVAYLAILIILSLEQTRYMFF